MSEEETTEINEMIIKCPACNVDGIAKSIMKEIEIPHFGKVLETTIQLISINHWLRLKEICQVI